MFHNASELEFGWPAAILMVTKEMLKFGYKLGQGLEVIGRGSLALIELSDNKGRFGLGYEPAREELFQASRGKKRKCAAQGKSIPHIKATFPAPIEVIMPKPCKKMTMETH